MKKQLVAALLLSTVGLTNTVTHDWMHLSQNTFGKDFCDLMDELPLLQAKNKCELRNPISFEEFDGEEGKGMQFMIKTKASAKDIDLRCEDKDTLFAKLANLKVAIRTNGLQLAIEATESIKSEEKDTDRFLAQSSLYEHTRLKQELNLDVEKIRSEYDTDNNLLSLLIPYKEKSSKKIEFTVKQTTPDIEKVD